jgi:voltage-gated potassium channel
VFLNYITGNATTGFGNINTGKGQRGLGRLWLTLLLFMMSVVMGTIGFMLIEKYTLLDAFYMSMITLLTVSFTEVQPLTNTGQLVVKPGQL